jgi:hypothetical protein
MLKGVYQYRGLIGRVQAIKTPTTDVAIRAERSRSALAFDDTADGGTRASDRRPPDGCAYLRGPRI